MGATGLGRAVPGAALRVIGAIEAAGYEAWVVGGWVRDALRDAPSHDVDVTTSAPWREGERVLRRAGIHVERTGVAHGTITAIVDGEPIEVTTYRQEGPYTDHRHPDYVRFVTDVREDLARRDLTVNAIAYHPERGLLDPFGGIDDIARGIVRAVGDPDERLHEDALRVLRAVRFSLRLGYAIEPATQRALLTHAPELAHVAPERVGTELAGIVSAGHAGRALTEQREVMCAALPELAPSVGFDQRSVYHIFDVYDHIAHVCRAVEAFTAGLARPSLRWAALLHDVAKPATFSLDVDGHGHFFDHPRQGAEMARAIMRRLALGSELTDAACCLIRLHDERMPLSAQAVRALLGRISRSCPGREGEVAFQLLDLRRADAVSKCPAAASFASRLDAYAALVRRELATGPVFSVRHLAVSGADVMRELGLPAGPGVGMLLEQLLRAVMADEVENEREALLSWLRGD